MSTVTRADVGHSFRAMASQVTARLIDPMEPYIAPGESAQTALARVEAIFAEVERTCSRFDSSSDLMRANAQPEEWTAVAPSCFDVIELASAAYQRTGGAFDPRVLRTLTAMGYDRSLDFSRGGVRTSSADLPAGWAREPWQPEFDRAGLRVRLGADPIDLGGIGKGYAVRRGIEALAGLGRAALVEAGGDLATYGDGPERAPGEVRAWRAAVEDPRAADGDDTARSIAVLDVSDAAVATSSIKLRRWRAGDRTVHHLIDPRSGEPAAAGLLSVTVVEKDPAWAEVWTKAVFLQGAGAAEAFAREAGIAALWVDVDGRLHSSEAMADRILWEAPDVR